jgi:type IV secretory pathway VirB6-like protein
MSIQGTTQHRKTKSSKEETSTAQLYAQIVLLIAFIIGIAALTYFVV